MELENKELEVEPEGKNIEINISDRDFIETASELRFKTLFLENFPIKYRNFSKIQKPIKNISLGSYSVNFGFEVLDSVNVKVLEFQRFKMLEFRKREFRLALGIIKNSDGTTVSNELFEYEIYSGIKNSRLKVILNFFTNLFKGTTVKFNSNDKKYEFDFINHIEHFKFNSIEEFLLKYEKIIKNLKLFKYKNLSEAENSLYEIDILEKANQEQEISTWINAKIPNDYDIDAGDILTLKRLYLMKFEGLGYDIEEEIILSNSIKKSEIKDNNIILNRKAVKIKYNKIHK